MELIVQALKKEDSWTSLKNNNPRANIHVNKLILNKINKSIEYIEKKYKIKLTQGQLAYCGALALEALEKGNHAAINTSVIEEQLRIAKSMNTKMATQIGFLHKQILDLKKGNAPRTNK